MISHIKVYSLVPHPSLMAFYFVDRLSALIGIMRSQYQILHHLLNYCSKWKPIFTKDSLDIFWRCDFLSYSLGNIVCVWALDKKDVELKPSFANLLKSLSIFDSIFLACVTLQFSMPKLSEHYLLWVTPYSTPYTLVLMHISLTGSVYTVGGK